MDSHTRQWCELDWTPWIPLESENRIYQKYIPAKPGIYRVRAKQGSHFKTGLFYIGQTGTSLRQRIYSLRNNAFRVSPKPWNDPHTAAPTLWAYRTENHYQFEVSVIEKHLSKTSRQCFEDYLIFCHRGHHNFSPTANFGVSHPLWNKPSNRATGRAMKKRKSRACSTSLPRATQINRMDAPDWLGLEWHGPKSLATADPPPDPGVYKFTMGGTLLYCGESQNLSRRISHYQEGVLREALLNYAVMPSAQPNHLKEREVDMIGAYFLLKEKCPRFQYTGRLHT